MTFAISILFSDPQGDQDLEDFLNDTGPPTTRSSSYVDRYNEEITVPDYSNNQP